MSSKIDTTQALPFCPTHLDNSSVFNSPVLVGIGYKIAHQNTHTFLKESDGITILSFDPSTLCAFGFPLIEITHPDDYSTEKFNKPLLKKN